MARCEQGYLCEVCGQEVVGIQDSDLYLRYVIGELDPEVLHTSPERHLRCNPVLSQFIQHPDFEAITVSGPFDRRGLDTEYVAARDALVSDGFARLLEIAASGGDRDVTAYPLADAIRKYRDQ